ncbi:uncharacterized protein LOC119770394 [Culex quinquefasciatus]|nr:uncharacterized protein LOC119770394 [Culex quinquefasciatus]XP_039443636.1 uncharacterized protein LOC120423784 [Culex pipiens pallens]
MSTPGKVHLSKPPIDILDEQFAQYLQLAQQLLSMLRSPQDRQIASKYIRRCCPKSGVTRFVHYKRNRNEFFRYFLKVLQSAVETQGHVVQVDDEVPVGADGERTKESCNWSDDRRTYVATKVIPNYATLVYMAVCDDPELGWDNGGFGAYEF